MKKYFCIVRLTLSGYLLTFEYVSIEPELLTFHLGPKDHFFEVCEQTFKHYYKGPNRSLQDLQDVLDNPE